MPDLSPFNPDVTQKLFLMGRRRVWGQEEYAQMAAQSSVPLHRYRITRDELKAGLHRLGASSRNPLVLLSDETLREVTPLGAFLWQNMDTATPLRFQRSVHALKALASPEITAGPPEITELGALMATSFTSLGSDLKSRGIMQAWQRQVLRHFEKQPGLEWEDAWRHGARTMWAARHTFATVHSEWDNRRLLTRWGRNLAGDNYPAPTGFADPSPDGCVRLMEEAWDRAAGWRDFPINHLHWVIQHTPAPQQVANTLVDRLAQWSVPLMPPLAEQAQVGAVVLAAVNQLERRGIALTTDQEACLGTLPLPELTARERQRQTATLEPPTPVRRHRLRA